MDLKEIAQLDGEADRHWYYRAKLAALRKATEDLPAGRIPDIGAGSAFFSRSLIQAGRANTAICVDPGYTEDRDETVAGRPLLFRRELTDLDGDCTLLLMMDVLEHVVDDASLVREHVARIPAGAHVIVTVPAFEWLWSGHDVFLDHQRRYSLPGMEALLRAAGLEIEFGSYFFLAALPAAVTYRLGQRAVGRGEPSSNLRHHGSLVNNLLLAVCRAELPLLRRNRFAGLSVFVRAVKP